MIYFQIFTTFRYKSLKNSDINARMSTVRTEPAIIPKKNTGPFFMTFYV